MPSKDRFREEMSAIIGDNRQIVATRIHDLVHEGNTRAAKSWLRSEKHSFNSDQIEFLQRIMRTHNPADHTK